MNFLMKKIFTVKLVYKFYIQAHGSEIPTVRYPDLIITGAKKCGTSALKIFMNYHTWFQDTPGERHFFNRPSNWKLGYQWYHDQMPLTFQVMLHLIKNIS